jgi:hypothetical protein
MKLRLQKRNCKVLWTNKTSNGSKEQKWIGYDVEIEIPNTTMHVQTIGGRQTGLQKLLTVMEQVARWRWR